MKQAIAYTRVSTKEQGAYGVGLDLQLEQINAFADASRITIVDVFQDVETGTGEAGIYKRNVLQQAVLKARDLGVPIIVSNIDRLTRNAKAMADFVANEGVQVIAADHGRKSKAVMVGEAARGELEAKLISERTKAALHRKKAEGVLLGNRTNLPDARAMSIVVRTLKAEDRAENLQPLIAEIRASGIRTCRGIAQALASRGIPAPRGGEWSPSAVKRLLDRIKAANPQVLPDSTTTKKPSDVWGTW